MVPGRKGGTSQDEGVWCNCHISYKTWRWEQGQISCKKLPCRPGRPMHFFFLNPRLWMWRFPPKFHTPADKNNRSVLNMYSCFFCVGQRGLQISASKLSYIIYKTSHTRGIYLKHILIVFCGWSMVISIARRISGRICVKNVSWNLPPSIWRISNAVWRRREDERFAVQEKVVTEVIEN